MTTLERFAWLIAVACFYVGSIFIAFQAAPAWEASLMLDAYEEAEYQQGLAQGYREVIVRGSDATEASLAVCVDTREKLEAEIAVRRPPMDRMADR